MDEKFNVFNILPFFANNVDWNADLHGLLKDPRKSALRSIRVIRVLKGHLPK
jgi:hypothetical protein